MATETKQPSSFEERLANEARRCKEQARSLRPSQEREALLRKARQSEIALDVNKWLSSPGLKPPK